MKYPTIEQIMMAISGGSGKWPELEDAAHRVMNVFSSQPDCSGLFDRNGREICLGDTIEIRTPYRNEQTHYGENIPRPDMKYTESLEPEIKIERFVVKFDNGMFHVDEKDSSDEDNFLTPLSWRIFEYKTRDDLINAFGGLKNIWIDEEHPGEDDLGYLLDQYQPNSEEELMKYLSGCEIIERD